MTNKEKEIEDLNYIKKNISNIDLHFIVTELNDILKEGFISNIYELPNTNILRFKCRSKQGNKNLIIDPQSRVNMTRFKYPTERYPSQFIMGLRKFMKGRRIQKIYQYNFDRIMVFQLQSRDGEPWKFVVELFGKGNYILVNGEGLTVFAKSYKKFRDRSILANKPYDFPRSWGTNIKDVNKENIAEMIEGKEKEIVRILARKVAVGGYVAEEMCLRAGIDKTNKPEVITEGDIDKIAQEFDEFNRKLNENEYNPHLILNKDKRPIGFEPLELKIYDEYEKDYRETFNEVIDDFFSRFETKKLYGGKTKKSKSKVKKYQKILKQQEKSIVNLAEKREKYQRIADLIYQNLYPLDNLIKTIMNQKRNEGKDWKDIGKILREGKEKDIPECKLFQRIFKKERKVRVNLGDIQYKMDLTKNASDNAQYLYEKASKCRKKIEGAKKAIKRTKEKIEKLKDKSVKVEEQQAVLLKEPKKKWYEKYRWFKSSDGFIIIGGRSANSNEALVKKHMNPNDLFFHTEVRGASVCLVKNDQGKEIPDGTIQETAQFAACYSSAWKKGWGNADIFYVDPEQVSKSPKAGEYLTKGSFIISGNKNYLPKPELELSIGLDFEPVNVPAGHRHANLNLIESKDVEIETKKEDGEEIQFYPHVLSAPKSAIKKQTKYFVVIRPAKNAKKTSDLAKIIRNLLIKMVPKPLKKWARLANLDAIIRKIPAGGGDIHQTNLK